MRTDLIQQIIHLHSLKLSIKKIAKELKCSANTVRNIYRTYNLSTYNVRKYALDETFLNSIEERQAYFLGWLWTDGCLVSGRNVISFQLQTQDKYILEYFSDWIFGQNLVKVYKRDTFKAGNYCSLQIYSHTLKQKCIDLGCSSNKTFTIEFPIISKEMYRHFMRGVLEGDGWISPSEYKINIASASLKFLHQIKDNIEVESRVIDGESNTKNLIIQGKKSVLSFLSWIYDDANYYLERKRDRYLKLKNIKRKCKLDGQEETLKRYYEDGYGTRKIAELLGVSREAVEFALKRFGLHIKNRIVRRVYLRTENQCIGCNKTLTIDKFRKRVKKDRISYEVRCKDCEKLLNKKRYIKNN